MRPESTVYPKFQDQNSLTKSPEPKMRLNRARHQKRFSAQYPILGSPNLAHLYSDCNLNRQLKALGNINKPS